jgi:hypothetical protein
MAPQKWLHMAECTQNLQNKINRVYLPAHMVMVDVIDVFDHFYDLQKDDPPPPTQNASHLVNARAIASCGQRRRLS